MQKSQVVQLFNDEPAIIGTQAVEYDANENWLTVTHNGETFNLSMSNWQQLVGLVNQCINESGQDDQQDPGDEHNPKLKDAKL